VGLGYHFKPKRGSLAAWWSCYRNGTQDYTSEHSSEPLLQGIKWNAARFFYDDTKMCKTPAAKTIRAPNAVLSLRDPGPSTSVRFGTTFPDGVWTGPSGTSTSDELHGGGLEAILEEDPSLYEELMGEPPTHKKKTGQQFFDEEKELLRKQAEAEMLHEQAAEAEEEMLEAQAAVHAAGMGAHSDL